MDMFEQAFAAAAEVSSDESWTRLQKYEEKEYYSATDVEINLDERTIGDLSGNVSTVGEDNSQYIQFIMDRYADGVDLTNMLIQVQYRLEDGQESVSAPVNAYASESRIRFGWPISRIATQKQQTIQFIVFCTGNREDGEPYVLKTKPISHRIEFTLGTGGTIIAPDENWFLQFENVMNEKMNQVAGLTEDAIDSAAGAKNSEQNAKQSASTASILASQVQSNTAQAKASADAAKVSEQNAKKSEDAARVYAGNASAVANVQIGTSDTAGLLRGGDIHIDESGALKMITTTDQTTMPNSHDGRLLIGEIEGVCEQDTTAGNQLFDVSTITAGYTINSNTGNPQSNTYFVLSDYIQVSSLTDYCLSQSNDVYFQFKWAYYDAEKAFISVDSKAGSNVKEHTFSTPENTAYIRFAYSIVVSGNAVDRGNISLNRGTEALPWEPYTGGIPSPNPSYPQEIKCVKGKNLLDCRGLVEQTNNGVKFTPIKDSNGNLLYIEANGKSSAVAIGASVTQKLTAGSYIVSGGANSSAVLQISDSQAELGRDSGSGFSLTLNKDTEITIRIRLATDVTATNLRFYPMIRKAYVKDPTYVPYGLLRVKTHGKNFLNARLNIEIGQSDLYTIYGISAGDDLVVYMKQQLTVLDPNYPTFQHYYWFHNKDGEILKSGTICYLSFESVNQIKEIASKLKAPEGTSYFRVTLGSYFGNSGSKAKTLEAQVEKATEFTGYEPYIESSIIFAQVELRKKGNAQDVLKDGKFNKKFGKLTFDGSDDEAWVASTTVPGRYYISEIGATINNLLCSHAVQGATYSEILGECYIVNTSGGRFSINTSFATLEEWKAQLANHAMTVIYELADAIVTDLPISDQVALNSLKTFDEATYFEFDTEVEPTFKGEYGTSKVGGYTLEALLTARNADLKVTAAQTAEE